MKLVGLDTKEFLKTTYMVELLKDNLDIWQKKLEYQGAFRKEVSSKKVYKSMKSLIKVHLENHTSSNHREMLQKMPQNMKKNKFPMRDTSIFIYSLNAGSMSLARSEAPLISNFSLFVRA